MKEKRRNPSLLREQIINCLPEEAIKELGPNLGSNLSLQELLRLCEKYGCYPPGFEPQEKENKKGAERREADERENNSVEKMRKFIFDQLPFFSQKNLETSSLKKIPLKELFGMYLEIFKTKPTNRENFRKFRERIIEILKKEADLGPDEIQNIIDKDNEDINYLKYLLMKLPKELRDEKNLNFDFSTPLSKEKLKELTKEAEKLNKNRDEMGYAMLVGLHISNTEYQKTVPPSKIESVTVLPGGEKIVVPAGYAHYTIKPTAYKEALQREGTTYLYLIEGSESHLLNLGGKYKEAHEEKGWLAAAGELPIIVSFELTDELMNALGLERV